MVNAHPAAEKAIAPPAFPPTLVARTAARLKLLITNITIEPATFIIAFANSLDDVSVKQLLIYKSCKVDFEFNDTVCDNLVQQYPDANKQVQDEIAQFGVYQEIAMSVFPIFFAFYLGAWCDTFGRKFVMYLFFIMKLIGQAILLVLAYYVDTPKEWYLLTMLPTSLIGGYAAFGMGLSAFIADISRPDQRAFRMGMIFLSQSMGRPLAAPLGAYLLKIGGYVMVIAASLGGIALGLGFLVIRMRSFKWVPQPKANNKTANRHPFSLYHVKDALTVTFRKRQSPNRKYLFLLMAMTMLQIVPFFGESSVAFLYVRTVFKWEVKEFSDYSSIVSSASIVAQAIIIPTLAIFHARDSLICIFVLFSAVVRHVIKGFSTEEWMYYLASFVDLIGHYSSSLIRAMLTCCVPLNEFGKIYSVLSAIDNILPMVLTQAYASLWKATSGTFPGAAFLMSAGFSCITLSVAIYIHFSLRGQRFSDVVHAEDKSSGIETENEEMKAKAEHNFYDDPAPPYYDQTYSTHI